MARFLGNNLERAQNIVQLYPDPRSATIPLCHLAQSQDGYLTEDAMDHIAELTGTTSAEVYGTASFYDMFQMEKVGKYVIGVCTNIACMLEGAYELIGDAEEVFGTHIGGTSADSNFTIEEFECIAACDSAPCLQVNYRFFGPMDKSALEKLKEDLLSGALADEVPAHGTLSRVERKFPVLVPLDEIDEERRRQDAEKASRIAEKGNERA